MVYKHFLKTILLIVLLTFLATNVFSLEIILNPTYAESSWGVDITSDVNESDDVHTWERVEIQNWNDSISTNRIINNVTVFCEANWPASGAWIGFEAYNGTEWSSEICLAEITSGGFYGCDLYTNAGIDTPQEINNLDTRCTFPNSSQSLYYATDWSYTKINYSLPSDNQGPHISLINPPNDKKVSSDDVNFKWITTDNMDSSLLCNLTLNDTIKGSNIESENNTETQHILYNLKDGIYYWNITCWDDDNNKNTSLTNSFTINSTIIKDSEIFNPTNVINSYSQNITEYINESDDIINWSRIEVTDWNNSISFGSSLDGLMAYCEIQWFDTGSWVGFEAYNGTEWSSEICLAEITSGGFYGCDLYTNAGIDTPQEINNLHLRCTHPNSSQSLYYATDWVYLDVNYSITNDAPIVESINLDEGIGNIDEIELNPGQTQRVWCNGTVFDNEGYSDLSKISGVLFNSETSSAYSAQDNNNHYKDLDCSTPLFTTDGSFSCAFDVYFFAQAGNWTCQINVSDLSDFSTTQQDNATFQELLAININNTEKDFGVLKKGSDTATKDFVDEVYNEGNVEFDIDLDTYDILLDSTNSFTCDEGYIPVENLRVSDSSGLDVFSKSFSPAQGVLSIDINHTPQTGSSATEPTIDYLYWGLIAPTDAIGSCTGHIRYIAKKSNN